MDPLAALERVAYLQDRGLLPTQKTAAFLKAADVVRELPPGELEQRAAELGAVVGSGRAPVTSLDGSWASVAASIRLIVQ